MSVAGILKGHEKACFDRYTELLRSLQGVVSGVS